MRHAKGVPDLDCAPRRDEMMAKGGKIAKDIRFEPKRLAARAVAPLVRFQRND
ncbi:hypothetical protein [Pseudoruegeria sp. SK021]|uniref:hypothetical protein n=1 Tax=Pseudoruegeria sp. SK021 TaxID=1933035 RepID=UPI00143D17E4|nr:hypothetical protein [Pseudoruegeria sp. SK021]